MLELLDLPELVRDHIFSYLSYDEIAKNRAVCRRFNELGWHYLNKGFSSAEKYQNSLLKSVKALLPRRESERRKHPLSKKCDVLMAIETRLSMLSMAFSRFVESKQCCFIPGKVRSVLNMASKTRMKDEVQYLEHFVIDELFRVMRSLDIDSNKEPQAPHQILQELRDVSTMAIEYFDEKIAPILRKKEMLALSSTRGLSVFDMPCEVGTTLKIDTGRFDLNLGSRALVHRQSVEKMVKDCCARMIKKNDDSKTNRKWRAGRKILSSLSRVVRRQERIIKELQETVTEQSVRLSNNDTIINDLKRQQDEWKSHHSFSNNFSDLSKKGKRKACPKTEEEQREDKFDASPSMKRRTSRPKKKRKTND